MFTNIRLQSIKMNISDILMLCLTALFLFSYNLSELLSIINIPATPYFIYWFNNFFPFFFIAYIFQRFNKIEEWNVNLFLSLIFMTIVATFSTYHSYLFISNKIIFDKDITSIVLDQNKKQVFKYDSSLRRVIISTKVKVEKEEFQNIEIELSLTEDQLNANLNKQKKQKKHSNIL